MTVYNTLETTIESILNYAKENFSEAEFELLTKWFLETKRTVRVKLSVIEKKYNTELPLKHRQQMLDKMRQHLHSIGIYSASDIDK